MSEYRLNVVLVDRLFVLRCWCFDSLIVRSVEVRL